MGFFGNNPVGANYVERKRPSKPSSFGARWSEDPKKIGWSMPLMADLMKSRRSKRR